jgi:hypothetical protein
MKPDTKAKPDRINIKISRKAYRTLSKRAKKEGRTLVVMLDNVLGV